MQIIESVFQILFNELTISYLAKLNILFFFNTELIVHLNIYNLLIECLSVTDKHILSIQNNNYLTNSNFLGKTTISSNKYDIIDYIDFIFSTPWQFFLNPNVEVLVFSQIIDNLHNAGGFEFLHEVLFQNIVFLYEFFLLFIIKFSNDFIFNNSFFVYLYINYYLNNVIYLYSTNLSCGLDSYYNIFLELLYENNNFNYGLNYDIIINKNMSLLHSDQVLNSLDSSFTRLNRHYIEFLEAFALNEDIHPFEDTTFHMAEEIGYRTTYSWSHYVIKNDLRYNLNASLFWFSSNHWLFSHDNYMSKFLYKFIFFNFFKLELNKLLNKVYLPSFDTFGLSNNLIGRQYSYYILSNSFKSTKELRFFGGYSSWYFYYQDNSSDGRTFLHPDDHVRFWWKISILKFKWVVKFNWEFKRRMPTYVVPDWKRWYFRAGWKYKYVHSNAFDKLEWKNYKRIWRNYLWTNDVFMRNIVFRNLPQYYKNAFFHKYFEPLEPFQTDRLFSISKKFLRSPEYLNKRWNIEQILQNDFLIKRIFTKRPFVFGTNSWKKKLNAWEEEWSSIKRVPTSFWLTRHKMVAYHKITHPPYKWKAKKVDKWCKFWFPKMTIENYHTYWKYRWQFFNKNSQYYTFSIKRLPPVLDPTLVYNKDYREPDPVYTPFQGVDFFEFVPLFKIRSLSYHALRLLDLSDSYSLRINKRLQSYWIRTYVNDVFHGDTMKHFLKNKGYKNVFYNNQKSYWTIKNSDGDVLMNMANKKYWTINNRSMERSYVPNLFNKNYYLNNNFYWKENMYLSKQIFIMKIYFFQKYCSLNLLKCHYIFTKYNDILVNLKNNIFEKNNNNNKMSSLNGFFHFFRKHYKYMSLFKNINDSIFFSNNFTISNNNAVKYRDNWLNGVISPFWYGFSFSCLNAMWSKLKLSENVEENLLTFNIDFKHLDFTVAAFWDEIRVIFDYRLNIALSIDYLEELHFFTKATLRSSHLNNIFKMLHILNDVKASTYQNMERLDKYESYYRGTVPTLFKFNKTYLNYVLNKIDEVCLNQKINEYIDYFIPNKVRRELKHRVSYNISNYDYNAGYNTSYNLNNTKNKRFTAAVRNGKGRAYFMWYLRNFYPYGIAGKGGRFFWYVQYHRTIDSPSILLHLSSPAYLKTFSYEYSNLEKAWFHHTTIEGYVRQDYIEDFAFAQIKRLPPFVLRSPDYRDLYDVYDSSFKKLLFYLDKSDFIRRGKVEFRWLREDLDFFVDYELDDFFEDIGKGESMDFYHNLYWTQNNVIQKWWDQNNYSFWYFLHPLLTRSMNIFIDYVNYINLPKNPVYDLYHNCNNIGNIDMHNVVNKYSLKQEFLPIFSNTFEIEKAVYYKYFFLSEKKKYYINFLKLVWVYTIYLPVTGFQEIYHYIIFLYHNNIYFKLFVYSLLFLFFTFFYVACSWIVLNFLKSQLPINNLYAVKTTSEDLKKLHKKRFIVLRKFFKNDLKHILSEDITFGLESKFIYSLEDTENFWVKKKVYSSPRVKNLHVKVYEKYQIFYKKFLSEEGFKFLEVPYRLKANFAEINDYWEIFTDSLSWVIFSRAASRIFNDRFFNYGRFVKEEQLKYPFKLEEFFIRFPQFVILRNVYNFIKVVLGAGYIYFKIKFRHLSRAISKDFYYTFFKKSLVIQEAEKIDTQKHLDAFFKRLNESQTFRWYRQEMDYFYKEVEQKDSIEADNDLFFSSKETHWDFHLLIWDFYKNSLKKMNEDQNMLKKEHEHAIKFLLLEKWKTNEELNQEKNKKIEKAWDDIFFYYNLKLDHYKQYNENRKDFFELAKLSKKNFSIFNFDVEDVLLSSFKFELKCFDYLIFNSLLNIVENDSMKTLLQQKIKDLYQNHNKEEVDNIEWIVKAHGSNSLYYNAKKSKKDLWLNLFGWRTDLLNEAYEKNIFYKNIQAAEDSKAKLDSIAAAEKNWDSKRKVFEKNNKEKIKEYFYAYRFYTTIGSRFYYLLTLFFDLFLIWFTHIKKIRWNEQSLESMFNIFIFDFKKYINKIFWQYVFLFNKEKIITKFNIRLWDVFFFTIWVLNPLCIYFVLFLIIYFVIYWLWFFFYILQSYLKIIKLTLVMRYQLIVKNSIFFLLFYKIYKIIFVSINFLITDFKTGKNIFDSLHTSLYIFLGFLQRSFFFIKGAYNVGKNKDGVFLGCVYACKWVFLKLKVFFEKKLLWYNICKKFSKKSNLKKKIKEKWRLLSLKISLLFFFFKFNRDVYFLFLAAEYFFRIFFSLFMRKFISYYDQYSVMLLYYYIGLKYVIFSDFLNDIKTEVMRIYNDIFVYLSPKEKIYFLYKMFIVKPFYSIISFFLSIFYNYFSKSWYFNPNNKNSWNNKIHYTLINRKLTVWLKHQIMNRTKWYFEDYLAERSNEPVEDFYYIDMINYSDFEYSLTGHDPRTYTWPKLYEYYLNFKHFILELLKKNIRRIELMYASYDNDPYWSKMSPIRRLIKIIYIYMQEYKRNSLIIYKTREESRNFFFYKKWKEKRKIIFIYFLKGLINWIFYKFFNKVIFTQIKELKRKDLYVRLHEVRYRKLAPRVSASIYFASNLKKIPPQLWLLSILYEWYYRGIIFYIFNENLEYYYTLKNKAPKGLRFKWRLSTQYSTLAPDIWSQFYGNQNITNGIKLLGKTRKAPKAMGLRYFLFMLEKQSRESLNFTRDDSGKINLIKSWFDTSFKFISTYVPRMDRGKDILLYEGRAFSTPDETALDQSSYYHPSGKPLLKELVKNLKKQQLRKSALKLKLSFHYMEADKAYIIPRVVEDVQEKEAELYHEDDTGMYYGEEIGKLYWLDTEKRLHTRWRFEKHVVHYETMLPTRLMKDDLLKEDELRKYISYYISLIYYEITLNQMIELMCEYVNIKDKYVKAIHVVSLPSLDLNLNYENIPDLNLNRKWKIDYGLNIKKYNRSIKLNRNEDVMWMPKIADYENPHLDSKRNVNSLHFFYYDYMRAALNTYFGKRAKQYYEEKRLFEKDLAKSFILDRIDIISIWNQVLSNRFKLNDDFKNELEIERLSIKWVLPKRNNNALKKPIFYLNVVKFSWKQWIHFDASEKESLACYRWHTFLLNERYNIWTSKLAPMRLPLPISLHISEESLNKLLMKFEKVYDSDFVNIFTNIRWTTILLKENLAWQNFKYYLSKELNVPVSLVLLWFFGTKSPKGKEDVFNRIKKKFVTVTDLFLLNSILENQTVLEASVRFAWDYMTFWETWKDHFEDINPYDLFNLRIVASGRSDISTVEEVDNAPFILYSIFVPRAFDFFYNKVRVRIIFLKYFGFFNLFIMFFECFYFSGEVFYNNWYLIIPFVLSLYSFANHYYLRKFAKEQLKGRDLYLYIFQASRRYLTSRIRLGRWRFLYKPKQWEKLEEEFGKDGKPGKEITWNVINSRYIKHRYWDITTSGWLVNIFFASWLLTIFHYNDVWRLGDYRGWDYYRSEYSGLPPALCSFQEIIWDDYHEDRVDSTGLIENLWYANQFRKKKNLSEWKIEDKYEEWEELPIITLRLLYKHSKTGAPHHITLRLPMYDRILMYWSNKIEKGREILKKELADEATELVNWSTMLQRRGEDQGTFIRYLESKGFKGRLRRYVKGYLREEKEQIYENFRADYTFREGTFNTIQVTRDLLKRDGNHFRNASDVILNKKREIFKSGEVQHYHIIANMSEYEKHYSILYYNFMKYKFYRWNYKKSHEGFNNLDDKILFLMNKNLNFLEVNAIKYVDRDWTRFIIKMAKIRKYIINTDLKKNKLELLKKLWEKKTETSIDMFDKFLDFWSLFYSWMSIEEIKQMLVIIIKFFF